MAQDRQRVRLQFNLAAKQRVGNALAVINRGQSNGHLALVRAQSQRLRRPACDGEVGAVVNPLQIDRRAQAIIPADIIAAQECAVARQSD